MHTISKTGSANNSKITKATSGITNTDFTGAMTEFITNISNIHLDTIPDFITCDKKLHLKRPNEMLFLNVIKKLGKKHKIIVL